MNKKIIITIVILLLLGVGGFAFWKMQQGKPGGTSTAVSGAKSLKDLLSSGVAQKCTFSTSDDSGSSEGTTYISGGKMRGDFTSVTSWKTVKSHMIVDGKTSYIWMDSEKTGFKSTIDESQSVKPTGTTTQEASTGSVDLSKQADYKCSAWVADGSLFSPPADVKFTDFSEMFKASSAPAAGSGGTSQCSVCDSLSGDDKTQCKSALKCQ